MANPTNEDFTGQTTVVEGTEDTDTFVESMLKKVRSFYADAKQFMRPLHDSCVESYQLYFSALEYSKGKRGKKRRVTTPFYQEQIDTFVAYMLDKIMYKNQPCTVVGLEDTDKPDAEAKQDMMKWQDYKDDIERKLALWLHDASTNRIAVAQVDFTEQSETRIVGVDQPIQAIGQDGQPTPMINPATGEPVTQRVIKAQEVPIYKGATCKRIDPLDFFITQDTDRGMAVRSRLDMADLKKKPYFINLTQLAGVESADGGGGNEETPKYTKRLFHNLGADQERSSKPFEYVEWQGLVNKQKLYEFLGTMTTIEHEGQQLSGAYRSDGSFCVVDPDDETTAIVGVINDQVVVRLEETPFDFNKPNILVGVIQPDEDEIIGTSLTDKLLSVVHTKNDVRTLLMENLKQSVNAGHVINRSALINAESAVVNEPGFVLETNTDVNQVHKRIDQPSLSKDLYAVEQMLTQDGQDASGLQDLITGRGEPGAETLGETELVAGQASLRLNRYLRSFEKFIISLYDMRNQINMEFLDQEYVYGIIGEGAVEWRTMTPDQIRANVDFICEASSRETNKLVITQQILQLAGIIPTLQQSGIPTRPDKLVARLCEQGFSWSEEQIEEFLPSLKLEKQGIDIDQMLMQNMLLQFNMQRLMAMGGMSAGGGQQQEGGAGGGQPQPRSEQEASASLNSRNHPQIGRNN